MDSDALERTIRIVIGKPFKGPRTSGLFRDPRVSVTEAFRSNHTKYGRVPADHIDPRLGEKTKSHPFHRNKGKLLVPQDTLACVLVAHHYSFGKTWHPLYRDVYLASRIWKHLGFSKGSFTDKFKELSGLTLLPSKRWQRELRQDKPFRHGLPAPGRKP